VGCLSLEHHHQAKALLSLTALTLGDAAIATVFLSIVSLAS